VRHEGASRPRAPRTPRAGARLPSLRGRPGSAARKRAKPPADGPGFADVRKTTVPTSQHARTGTPRVSAGTFARIGRGASLWLAHAVHRGTVGYVRLPPWDLLRSSASRMNRDVALSLRVAHERPKRRKPVPRDRQTHEARRFPVLARSLRNASTVWRCPEFERMMTHGWCVQYGCSCGLSIASGAR
jgi:hypothetical protein